MARRRLTRTRRDAAVTRAMTHAWSDPTTRDACYQTSVYQDQVWRETYESASVNERAMLARADDMVPGFSRIFGREILHRLYERIQREIPAESRGPGAKVRGKVHAIVPDLSELRRVTVFDMPRARHAALTCVANMAHHLLTLPKAQSAQGKPKQAQDPEKQASEKAALQDLGLEGEGEPGKPSDQASEQPGAGAGASESSDEHKIGPDPGISPEAMCDAIESEPHGANTPPILPRPETCDGKAFQPTRTVAPEDRAVSTEREEICRKLPAIKDIVALAGRLSPTLDRLASDMRAKGAQGREGVTLTGDVSRLATFDLACLSGALGSPLEDRATRDLLAGRAMGYEGRGSDVGPMVVLLDQSGSMNDDGCGSGRATRDLRDRWSKAIVLALAWHCQRQGRAFALIRYSSGIRSTDSFATLTDASLQILYERIALAPGGGTWWGTAMQAGLGIIRDARGTGSRLHRSDIVHVTDGTAGDIQEWAPHRIEAQAMRVKVLGIGVGVDAAAAVNRYREAVRVNAEHIPHTLESWCDATCPVADGGDDGEAMTRIAAALA